MHTDIVTALLNNAGVIISAIAAIFAVVFGFSARDQARKADESAREIHALETKIAKEANHISALTWSDQYVEALRLWANEVVEAMAEAAHLCQIQDDRLREERWLDVRAKLSALADSGRWYFPNRYEDRVGQSKAKAYRGIRQEPLDCIIHVYNAMPESPKFCAKNEINKGNYPLEIFHAIEKSKRIFVSNIQDRIDPRQREGRLSKIEEEFSSR